MTFEDLNNDDDVANFTRAMTGHPYSFALADHRKWGEKSKIERGEFYQLMPDRPDDGFFNWYCDTRPFNQFFKTKEMCLIHFLKYHHDWEEAGQPARMDTMDQN